MQSKSDAQLLREYARHGAEAAFTEIVTRHTNLVYSAALRQTESPDMAADIAQRVFIGLAQAAQTLSRQFAEEASVAGWLCRSTRNVSLNLRRDEFRRHSRERLAMDELNPNSETAPDWEKLRAVLDDAMSDLDESDYDALVMRYFRNQDLRSVGQALGVSDDTAQKRVSRALDKLHLGLIKRGITTTAAALSLVLSAHAVQAAPAGLVAIISTAAALAGGAVKTSTAIAVTKNIIMTTLQKALVATTLAVAVGTGIYEAHRASNFQEQAQKLQLQQDSMAQQLQAERDAASNALAAAQRQSGSTHSDMSELLKLRAEVTKLRGDARELARLKSGAAANQDDPTASEANSWLQRVKKLRDKVDQMPGQRIPEFQYLTDQDWLDAARKPKELETDADFSQALRQLRSSAQHEFASMVGDAISSYAKANNGQMPGDFSQLNPFFASAVDDSVLQGYDFSQPGTVTSKPGSLIDQDGNYYYSKIQITANSVGMTTDGEDGLHQAIQAYLAANNGQSLTDPSQLLPYVQTPVEQATLQKIIQGAAAK
ncbi:MAG TPA: sigma-70 family RNA polymerase sigma factor [Verrucomicrobiae bacterium]|jgi:RNA polymerase sigma factor (sigma-70 family)|nr:sigma-70 family RNA polymerase sigma factor [Verrucomicrobiae bacterium]